MTTELWITIGIAIAGGLAFLAYTHPKLVNEKLLPITGITWLIFLLHNIAVLRASNSMSEYLKDFDYEVQSAISVIDGIGPAYVPIWMFVGLGLVGGFLGVLGYIATLIHDDKDTPKNASGRSPPSPEPKEEE